MTPEKREEIARLASERLRYEMPGMRNFAHLTPEESKQAALARAKYFGKLLEFGNGGKGGCAAAEVPAGGSGGGGRLK